MTPRPFDRAALDRWITGDCWPYRRRARVLARCAAGHTWRTVAVTDCGTTELVKPECPTCGEEAEEWDYAD